MTKPFLFVSIVVSRQPFNRWSPPPFMMNNKETNWLLTALLASPGVFSLIEAHYADELEDRGLFDLDTFSVTAAGRDFLQTNDSTVRVLRRAE